LVNPPPGDHIQLDVGEFLLLGEDLRVVLGVSALHLQAKLEQASPDGESRFGLFRAARQSTGPVEEFMHLYNLLLMICNEDQGKVDAFVRREEPGVPQTPSPHRPGVMETVYTRLRNELGHTRKGVNLQNTKAEMANRLGGGSSQSRSGRSSYSPDRSAVVMLGGLNGPVRAKAGGS
jgi:hypothetical protein